MSLRLARLGALRLGLAGLCACLLAVIALEISPEPGIAQAEAGVAGAPGPAPVALPAELAALAPLQHYAAIVERPLFDASRRPPPIEESATPAVAADLRQLTLTGVVIAPDARFAIFQDQSPARTVRLARGTRVGEWLLDEIHPDGVVFRRGGARQRLALYEKKDRAPALADAAHVAGAQAAAKEQAKTSGEPRRRGPRRRR